MTLDEITAKLRERLPSNDESRTAALVATAVIVSRQIMADLHFSPVESRRLRGAIARIDLADDEREALASLIERDSIRLREVSLDPHAERALASLGDGLYDALVDLAAAVGPLYGLIPLMPVLGATTAPADRAAELGIERPVRDLFVGTSAGSVRFDDQQMTIGHQLHEVTIRWSNLVRFEAVDPWPRVHVTWRERGYSGDAFFTAQWDRESFAARIEALFVFARALLGDHVARKLERGWVGRPDVAWEEVAKLPDEERVADDGAYRTSARARPTEPILARRARPSSLEKLLCYLASAHDRRWADFVGAIVVTDAYLYAERGGGRAARLPLSQLRTRIGERDGVYIFGRRTRVILPQREGPCPVAQHLDAILRGRAS